MVWVEPDAGRSRRVAGDAADACYQVVHFCGEWRRLYAALQDRGEGKRGEHQLREDLSALRRELRRTDAAVLALERIASEGLPKSPRR